MQDRKAKADVGPVRQRTQFTCMSTSLMMCLQANGVKCDEEEVNKVMGAAPMKGAAWEHALAAAQHYGMRATLTVPATVKQLKAWTDSKIPIMIAWNPEGRDWSHASVVYDVTEGLPDPIPSCCTVQGEGTGLYVWVADPNIPHPERTTRIVHEDAFYSKWYEKWPNYLVRRPACAIEPEITRDGQQRMASSNTTSAERVAARSYGYTRERRREINYGIESDAEVRRMEYEDRDARRVQNTNKRRWWERVEKVLELIGTRKEKAGFKKYRYFKPEWDEKERQAYKDFEKQIKAKYKEELTDVGFDLLLNPHKLPDDVRARLLECEEPHSGAQKTARDLLIRVWKALPEGTEIRITSVPRTAQYSIKTHATYLDRSFPKETVVVGFSYKVEFSVKSPAFFLDKNNTKTFSLMLGNFRYWEEDVFRLMYLDSNYRHEPALDSVGHPQFQHGGIQQARKKYPVGKKAADIIAAFIQKQMDKDNALRRKREQDAAEAAERKRQRQHKPVVDSALREKFEILDKLITDGFPAAQDAAQDVKDAYEAGDQPTDSQLKALRNMLYRSRMRNEANHFRQASTGAECTLYLAKDNQWYMDLEDMSARPGAYDDEYDDDAMDSYDTEWVSYGPFDSLQDAKTYLRRNFANPGGYDVDKSKREHPPRNPISPQRRRRWAATPVRGTDNREIIRKVMKEMS